MKNAKNTLSRMVAFILAFAVAFTFAPVMTGEINVHAASVKKPAKVQNLKTTAATQTSISLKWNKVKTKGTKGYAVYRYNAATNKWACAKVIKKASTVSLKDTGLKAGTTYKYRIRAYTTYKQYYNTKTKKWVNKKPKAKYWKTKESRNQYKWGAYSAILTKKTNAAPAPADKDPVFTGSSITGTTSMKLNTNASYDYTVAANGDITWSLRDSDKSVAVINSTFKSSKNTTRSCNISFKKAGTVVLSAKSSLNGKSKALTITVTSSTSGTPEQPDPVVKRTEYKCTNFLGNSYTLWKDTNGRYWDASTGGSEVTNLSEYDRTVDGKWNYGQNYVQQGGVTVVGVYYRPTNNHLVDVKVYNGDTSNVKLIVREETKKYQSSEGNDFGQTFVLDAEGNRIGMYYSDSSDPSKIRFDLSNSFGFDGFVGGTIHIDGYYDFDKNGILTDDEYIGTREITVSPKQAATDAYEIAKAATTYYGTSTYQADMAAIRAYLYKNYEHNSELNGVNMYTCIGGANIMKAWSIKNYKVLGTVYVLPSSSHEEFFPVSGNPYTVRESFTAEGYLSSAPPGSSGHTDKLARLEADVAEYKAAEK